MEKKTKILEIKEKIIEELEEKNNDFSKIKKELDLEIVNLSNKNREAEMMNVEKNKEILSIVSEKKKEVKKKSENEAALHEEKEKISSLQKLIVDLRSRMSENQEKELNFRAKNEDLQNTIAIKEKKYKSLENKNKQLEEKLNEKRSIINRT